MNTAMMVTRVSLLLVVTGLFAGMWSADSPDLSPAEKQLARRESTPRLLLQAAKSSPNVRTVSLSDQLPSIPLPVGIEGGTYLVVDQTGVTQRLTIEARNTSASTNFAAIDQLVLMYRSS